MMALSSHVTGSSQVPQRNTVDSGPGFRFMSFDVVISSMDKYIRRFVGIACVPRCNLMLFMRCINILKFAMVIPSSDTLALFTIVNSCSFSWTLGKSQKVTS